MDGLSWGLPAQLRMKMYKDLMVQLRHLIAANSFWQLTNHQWMPMAICKGDVLSNSNRHGTDRNQLIRPKRSMAKNEKPLL